MVATGCTHGCPISGMINQIVDLDLNESYLEDTGCPGPIVEHLGKPTDQALLGF